MFGLAAAETGSGLNACKGYDLLPTKPENRIESAEGNEPDKVDNFVNNLYRIRASRLSGFPKSESEITYLQYESLVTLEFLIEQTKQQSEVHTRLLMEEIIKGTAQ